MRLASSLGASMRSASSRAGGAGSVLRGPGPSLAGLLVLLTLLAVAAGLATSSGASPARQPGPEIAVDATRIAESTVTTAVQRRLAAAAWQGGAYTAATGAS